MGWPFRQAPYVPRSSPYKIDLTDQERAELVRRAAKYTLPYYQVVRAKMILHAAEGLSNDDIARCLDTQREVVSQWRKRFFEERLSGLEERPRPGRPRSFSP
jgi:DNA-binding CsgD family transcriptional regulator